jgi:hypothetical protein
MRGRSIVVALVLTMGSVWAVDDFSQWRFFKVLSVVGQAWSADQADYQIAYTCSKAVGTDSGATLYLGANVRDDFGDVRFRDANGLPLAHWRERYVSGQSALFWVKVPRLARSATTRIDILYGNALATSASNGSATFHFFDDFLGDYAGHDGYQVPPGWQHSMQDRRNDWSVKDGVVQFRGSSHLNTIAKVWPDPRFEPYTLRARAWWPSPPFANAGENGESFGGVTWSPTDGNTFMDIFVLYQPSDADHGFGRVSASMGVATGLNPFAELGGLYEVLPFSDRVAKDGRYTYEMERRPTETVARVIERGEEVRSPYVNPGAMHLMIHGCSFDYETSPYLTVDFMLLRKQAYPNPAYGSIVTYANPTPPTTAASAPTAGLVGHWKFDEATGFFANDASGTGNVGTLQARPTWVTGKSGTALSFTDLTQNVYIANSPSLNVTGSSITLAAWIYPSPSSGGAIIHKEGQYTLYRASAGSLTYADSTSWSYAKTGYYGSAPNYTWSHVAVTFDGAYARFYVNGVSIGAVPRSGAIAASTSPVYIASYAGAAYYGYTFLGTIDDARIYNRALSASEVAALYNPGSGGAAAPVVMTQPASKAVYAGPATTLSAVANGTAPLYYQWQRNGVDIVGAIEATCAIPWTGVWDTGSYRVLISNNAGSTVSSSAALTVVGPTISISPSVVAPGQSVTVSYAGNAFPTDWDWISIVTAGAADAARLSWSYSGGKMYGSVQFPAPDAVGVYDFRYFADNWYWKLATSPTLTVR